MKSSSGWIAAGLVVFVLPALAQTAGPADIRQVEKCLAGADQNGGFGGQCIGAVADKCIAAASNRDNYIEESKKCAARELSVWNGLMSKALQSAKPGGKNMLASVQSAQKSWISSVQTLCPVFDKLDPGMSLGGATYCRLQEAGRRALLLRRLSAAVNEH